MRLSTGVVAVSVGYRHGSTNYDAVSSKVNDLACENSPRIIHQHRSDLILGDSSLFERRNHVVVDMKIVPIWERGGEIALGQPIVETGGVVREDHLIRVTTGAEPGYCFH